MSPKQINSGELDRLMRNVLASDVDLVVPSCLSERVIQKLERKALLRELVLELLLKGGLVLGSLAILAGVLMLVNGTGLLTRLFTRFADNWQIIASLLFLALVTILIDQIGLRFYHAFNRESTKG